MTTRRPFLSIVAPVFNEAESIEAFLSELRRVLTEMQVTFEVILVDDGSTDQSEHIIKAFSWKKVRLLSLVANAGHMAALDAGLREARGDYVISMDSDLQHPPRLIPELVRIAQANFSDVVYAQREQRSEEGALRRSMGRAYYRGMRWLSGIDLVESAADFRLLSHAVIEVIRQIPRGNNVYRMLIPALGFSSSVVAYEAAPRHSGSSKYTARKLLGLSTMSIVGYSTKPLTISIRIGLVFSIAAIVGLGYVFIAYLSGEVIQGWASVLSSVLLSSGVILVNLGVMGRYLAVIAQKLGGRPDYIIRSVVENSRSSTHTSSAD